MAVYALENGVPVFPSARQRGAPGPQVSGSRRSRREWLAQASRLAAGLPVALSPMSRVIGSGVPTELPPAPQQESTQSVFSTLFTSDPTKYRFTRDEDQFLEELERACFQFFWDESNPYTGLVKDRSQADGSDSRNVASIAATGFGLGGMCIADLRGWEDKKKIRERVRNTLRFVDTRVPQAHGFFCHFLNFKNGERAFQSEVSSIDTAIFICGVLTCRAYFEDAEIKELATRLYDRVDWNWLLHGEKTLSMG